MIKRHARALYEAETAGDALERTVALRPSLIITDLAMPKMDGLALLHAVRVALLNLRSSWLVVTDVWRG
jgi:YesN/AraC family two-component response regulator